MSKKSAIKFKLAELKAFVDDPKSCVKCIRQKQHLSIAPWCLSDLKTSIENILNHKTGRYDKSLDGILLSARNITLLSSLGSLRNDSPEIHLNIEADFYIFQPVIGSILDGIVVKKSMQFIGCLVHKVFNISIPRLNDQKQWPGKYLEIGQNVTFKIVSMDLLGKLPYIKGEIDTSAMEFEEEEEEDITEMNDMQEVQTSDKKHKKNKKRHFDISEMDESFGQTNGDTVDNEIQTKKQKKHKKNVQDIMEVTHEENDQNGSFSKKKKKRDKNRTEIKPKIKSECEDNEYTNSLDQNNLSINKDKYKIKKENKDNDGLENPSGKTKQIKITEGLTTQVSPVKLKKSTDVMENSKTKNDLLNSLLKVAQDRCSISPVKKIKHKKSDEFEISRNDSPKKEKNNNKEAKSERKHKRKIQLDESPDVSPVKKLKLK